MQRSKKILGVKTIFQGKSNHDRQIQSQVQSALDNFEALFLLTSLHLAQAKEGPWERMKEKIKITKELHDLKLTPDKEAALLALNQKYGKERQDLVAALKKYREDLKPP